MKTNLVILAVILTATFIFGVAEKYIAPLRPAYDFTFADTAGKTYQIKDFQDDTVLIHFWASWCAPCVAEFPPLLSLAEKYPNDLTVIALSIDHDKQAMSRFLKKYAPDTPPNIIFAMDTDKKISRDMFGTIQIPETYILSPGLTLKDKITGPGEWMSADIRARIFD